MMPIGYPPRVQRVRKDGNAVGNERVSIATTYEYVFLVPSRSARSSRPSCWSATDTTLTRCRTAARGDGSDTGCQVPP